VDIIEEYNTWLETDNFASSGVDCSVSNGSKLLEMSKLTVLWFVVIGEIVDMEKKFAYPGVVVLEYERDDAFADTITLWVLIFSADIKDATDEVVCE